MADTVVTHSAKLHPCIEYTDAEPEAASILLELAVSGTAARATVVSHTLDERGIAPCMARQLTASAWPAAPSEVRVAILLPLRGQRVYPEVSAVITSNPPGWDEPPVATASILFALTKRGFNPRGCLVSKVESNHDASARVELDTVLGDDGRFTVREVAGGERSPTLRDCLVRAWKRVRVPPGWGGTGAVQVTIDAVADGGDYAEVRDRNYRWSYMLRLRVGERSRAVYADRARWAWNSREALAAARSEYGGCLEDAPLDDVVALLRTGPSGGEAVWARGKGHLTADLECVARVVLRVGGLATRERQLSLVRLTALGGGRWALMDLQPAGGAAAAHWPADHLAVAAGDLATPPPAGTAFVAGRAPADAPVAAAGAPFAWGSSAGGSLVVAEVEATDGWRTQLGELTAAFASCHSGYWVLDTSVEPDGRLQRAAAWGGGSAETDVCVATVAASLRVSPMPGGARVILAFRGRD